MKKHLHNSLRALFVSLAVLLSLPMLAETIEIEGINYELIAENNEATVVARSSYRYSGEIVIPISVEYEGVTYSVTSIGEYAFVWCSGMTSVTIPNSVTSIGDYAFSGCHFAKEKFINYSSLDASENDYWGATFYDYETEDGLLINDTTVLFCRRNVTSVTIPNGVKSIGKSAFSGCSGLTSVTIGNSVTSIGESAFYKCSGLTSVSIGNSVTSIGESAFSGCSGLTSVTIGNSVASIGSEAFYKCSSLISVHISDIGAWCNIAFVGYRANPLYYASSLYLNGEEVKDLVIPNSVTSIGSYAFYNCSGLTSVTIGNSVASIGSEAFYGCSGLTSVSIGNSVTSIGESAFSGCSGLTSVTIGDSVTGIGRSAFYGCSGLTSVTIGDSVTSIGSYAFYNCSGLTSVTIGNSVASIGSEAFYGCSGLTSVSIPNSVTSIGSGAFRDTKLQTIVCKSVEVPSISTNIVRENLLNHTQVYVPEGTYWDYAFSYWGYFVRIKEMAMNEEDLESGKAYMIADASGRNYTVYDTNKGELVNVAYTHALDEESEGSCWTTLKDGEASYLYNIGARKYGYITENGELTLSDTPIKVDITNTEDGLSINGNTRMFVLNQNIKFDATAIDEIKSDNTQHNSDIYDLSGRRVNSAQKGIYIQNCKKVLVK